jgi:hypothetical protein
MNPYDYKDSATKMTYHRGAYFLSPWKKRLLHFGCPLDDSGAQRLRFLSWNPFR